MKYRRKVSVKKRGNRRESPICLRLSKETMVLVLAVPESLSRRVAGIINDQGPLSKTHARSSDVLVLEFAHRGYGN